MDDCGRRTDTTMVPPDAHAAFEVLQCLWYLSDQIVDQEADQLTLTSVALQVFSTSPAVTSATGRERGATTGRERGTSCSVPTPFEQCAACVMYAAAHLSSADTALGADTPDPEEVHRTALRMRDAARGFDRWRARNDPVLYLSTEAAAVLNSNIESPSPRRAGTQPPGPGPGPAPFSGSRSPSAPRGTKRNRCPNGFVRVPAKTGDCVPKTAAFGRTARLLPPSDALPDPEGRKRAARCPNGTRRIPAKTGDCVPVRRGGGCHDGGCHDGGCHDGGRHTRRRSQSGGGGMHGRCPVAAIRIERVYDALVSARTPPTPTAIQLLVREYSAAETPELAVQPKRRGRPPKNPVKRAQKRARIDRHRALWDALYLSLFVPVVGGKGNGCSTPRVVMETALVHSGEQPRPRTAAAQRCLVRLRDTGVIDAARSIPPLNAVMG